MELLGVYDGGGVEIYGYGADGPSKRDACECRISQDDAFRVVSGLGGV